MARTLSEIYQEAKTIRDQKLELTEFHNGSKMSVLDAFTWVTSACIWSFETLLDTWKVDVASDLYNRVNGTPSYYANAILKYQHGDQLIMNDEGTQFYYSSIDESKRVVTKVAYSEVNEETEVEENGQKVKYRFYDKDLVLKIASGTPGAYKQIDSDTLTAIRSYMQSISFAGTHMTIVSRLGDVLIPRVTVFYDGGISPDDMYQAIETNLNDYVANLQFDGAVYVQKIIDTIQRIDHVTDVYIDNNHTDYSGIFIAQYNDDNNMIIDSNGKVDRRVDRYVIPNSGYLRQATPDEGLPTWRESITLVIEKPNTGFIAD